MLNKHKMVCCSIGYMYVYACTYENNSVTDYNEDVIAFSKKGFLFVLYLYSRCVYTYLYHEMEIEIAVIYA